MNKPVYKYHQFGRTNRYFFISNGICGAITKAVTITRIESDQLDFPHRELYNLAFGDVKEVDNSWIFDDSSRSNNGDMSKVLATVVRIAIDFMTKNKMASLLFSGHIDQKSSTLGRNQRNILYQRAIESNWRELNIHLQFWGFSDNQQEDYLPGKPYERILVQHK